MGTLRHGVRVVVVGFVMVALALAGATAAEAA